VADLEDAADEPCERTGMPTATPLPAPAPTVAKRRVLEPVELVSCVTATGGSWVAIPSNPRNRRFSSATASVSAMRTLARKSSRRRSAFSPPARK
jgi:hypothetical protein